MSRSALVGSLLFMIAGGAVGCSNSSGATMAEPEATALPPIKVDLPPPPANLGVSDVPEKLPNGDWTIYGLRKNKKRNCIMAQGAKEPPADCQLNKDVKVSGYLLEVYQCPKCPKGQTCKMCDQPHFFLGDKPDTKKEKALMVVDYLAPKQKPPALTVGKQYEVNGNFAINSPTGFGASDGLLVFDSMTDDKGVPFMSPAKALEEKALKGEAQAEAEAKSGKAPKKHH